MKERPILFSAPMVRALLDDRKTQTRRVVKAEIPDDADEVFFWSGEAYRQAGLKKVAKTGLWARRNAGPKTWLGFIGPCPYGVPGDRLWVREAWSESDCPGGAMYRADCDPRQDTRGFGWRPSIHMPRWASRILLEITDVRVERLNNISEADARAEGLQFQEGWMPQYRGADDLPWRPEFPRDAYLDLWESINGPGSWAANPWVWVVEFKRVEAV